VFFFILFKNVLKVNFNFAYSQLGVFVLFDDVIDIFLPRDHYQPINKQLRLQEIDTLDPHYY
jgi:hypothetical protein